MVYVFLMINGHALAMFSCWGFCGDNDIPEVLQKAVVDRNGHQSLYQYSPSSNRWKLVEKSRSNPHRELDVIFTYYLQSKSKGQIKVYEGENGAKNLKLLETLTIEQHKELDLKQDGKFVTGTGQ